jgi:hypothetical protein
MKINPVPIILLVITMLLACDENFVIVKCEDCLDSEPTEARVSIDVDFGTSFGGEVLIYEGNIEDNILMSRSTGYGGNMVFMLEINKKYTFKVEYIGPEGVRYSAINSVYPRVKLELEKCSGSPCYYVYDNKLNMKIKYLM